MMEGVVTLVATLHQLLALTLPKVGSIDAFRPSRQESILIEEWGPQSPVSLAP